MGSAPPRAPRCGSSRREGAGWPDRTPRGRPPARPSCSRQVRSPASVASSVREGVGGREYAPGAPPRRAPSRRRRDHEDGLRGRSARCRRRWRPEGKRLWRKDTRAARGRRRGARSPPSRPRAAARRNPELWRRPEEPHPAPPAGAPRPRRRPPAATPRFSASSSRRHSGASAASLDWLAEGPQHRHERVLGHLLLAEWASV